MPRVRVCVAFRVHLSLKCDVCDARATCLGFIIHLALLCVVFDTKEAGVYANFVSNAWGLPLTRVGVKAPKRKYLAPIFARHEKR